MSEETFAVQFPHGALCGCECGCSCPLGEGNYIARPYIDAERDWDGTEITPRVDLIVCVNCLTGSHRAARQSTEEQGT